MLPRIALVVLAALAPELFADDLPPGVLMLSRIKRHVREDLGHLPDYTCLQTAQRYHGPADKPAAQSRDVVRLEILYAGDKEMYGAPGARTFQNDDPSALTAGGLSGTGLFALHLRTIFMNDNAMSQYRGEDPIGGRRAVRYDYRVPLMLSGWTIRLGYGAGTVSARGSFWADPDTLDLLRLEVNADDIPSNLPLVSATQTVEYGRTRIGERDVMLPQRAEIRLLQEHGVESRNVIEFTHCRSFAAESNISFDTPAPAAATAAPAPAKVTFVDLPPGLIVAVALTSPITENDAVGGLIEARVAENVRDKAKIVIPAGAVVRGRIRRLERFSDAGPYYVVGLEFTEIEMGDSTARFFANLDSLDEKSGASLFLTQRTTTPERVTRVEQTYAAHLPGVASFFVKGATLKLPAGFKIVWKTTSPRSANR